MSRIKTTKIEKKRDQKDGFVYNVGILYDQKHNYKSKKVHRKSRKICDVLRDLVPFVQFKKH